MYVDEDQLKQEKIKINNNSSKEEKTKNKY